MGNKYPSHYPEPATYVAEEVVRESIPRQLHKRDGLWEASDPLISNDDFNQVMIRFRPGTHPGHVLRLIGLAFSKVLPWIHYEFTSNGYFLKFKDDSARYEDREIVIGENPPGEHGYQAEWQRESYTAALQAVRSLIEWRLITFRASNKELKWPVASQERGASEFIFGELYKTVRNIGDFAYVRPRLVIELIEESVPDLWAEWTDDGYELVPNYHSSDDSKRFITLQLREIR